MYEKVTLYRKGIFRGWIYPYICKLVVCVCLTFVWFNERLYNIFVVIVSVYVT